MRSGSGDNPNDSIDAEGPGAKLLAALRSERVPETPAGLTARILQRAYDQLTLHAVFDLMTAGFARVLSGGWLPDRNHSAQVSDQSPESPPTSGASSEPGDDRNR